jgi:hypothetical protein
MAFPIEKANWTTDTVMCDGSEVSNLFINNNSLMNSECSEALWHIPMAYNMHRLSLEHKITSNLYKTKSSKSEQWTCVEKIILSIISYGETGFAEVVLSRNADDFHFCDFPEFSSKAESEDGYL